MFRKYGRCLIVFVLFVGIVYGFRRFFVDVGGWRWVCVLGVFSGVGVFFLVCGFRISGEVKCFFV